MAHEHDYCLFCGGGHSVFSVVAFFDMLVAFRVGFGGSDVHLQQRIILGMLQYQICFDLLKQSVH